MAEVGDVIGKVVFDGNAKPHPVVPQHLFETFKKRQELEAENERLRNGLRYLSVKLGVSSNLVIGKLSCLAWNIAEEGEKAPRYIKSKQEVREEDNG